MIYLAAILLVLAYVVYNFVYPSHVFAGDRLVLWIRLVVISLFVLVSFPAAYFVQGSFGYVAMERVGLDFSLQAAYKTYSVFAAFFKLDLILGTTCVYLAGMSLLKPNELLLAAGALLVTLIGTGGGLYVAKTGKKQWLWSTFFFITPFEPCYIIYKLVMFFEHERRYRSRVQYVDALVAVGALALLVRILLVIFALRVKSNGPLAAIKLAENAFHVAATRAAREASRTALINSDTGPNFSYQALLR